MRSSIFNNLASLMAFIPAGVDGSQLSQVTSATFCSWISREVENEGPNSPAIWGINYPVDLTITYIPGVDGPCRKSARSRQHPTKAALEDNTE